MKEGLQQVLRANLATEISKGNIVIPHPMKKTFGQRFFTLFRKFNDGIHLYQIAMNK